MLVDLLIVNPDLWITLFDLKLETTIINDGLIFLSYDLRFK